MLLTLPAVPPFRLDLTVWALRRREKNIFDQWDGVRYIRTLAYGKDSVKITATSGGTEGDPQLIITLESNADLTIQRYLGNISFNLGIIVTGQIVGKSTKAFHSSVVQCSSRVPNM